MMYTINFVVRCSKKQINAAVTSTNVSLKKTIYTSFQAFYLIF